MPKQITQYRVFIASPGGLEKEREQFRRTLERYTLREGEPRGVAFHPVGWEETIGGVGRPQVLVNEDLRQCDYAVFIFHDRWGSPTGDGHSSGTAEEWALAEELYAARTLRNIALFFKAVDSGKLTDPGEQLKAVLAFKKKVEAEKKYLFKKYTEIEELNDELRGHLAKWLRDHEAAAGGSALPGIPPPPSLDVGTGPAPSPAPSAPSFDYWIERAVGLLEAEPADTRNYNGAFFCAEQAKAAAASSIEWAWAMNSIGIAQLHLNEIAASIAAFSEIADKFSAATNANERGWQARALVNTALALGLLDRSAEAIAVYDDVIGRFGMASELALREQVAKALFNKGVRLGLLDRNAEAIAAYDDLIGRFGTAPELALREQVAKALVNEGAALGALEAIAVYDDVADRFGTAGELALRKQVAMALVGKGVVLDELGRSAEAIAAYDDVVGRFGTAGELALREWVAKAIVNKGIALRDLDRSAEASSVFNEVISRFGGADEPVLKEVVERAQRLRGELSKSERRTKSGPRRSRTGAAKKKGKRR
jgi:tetratricopeptide (TPR) repeat protein